MTYPPQGGYPDDPNYNGQDAQSPFGYPDQPASPPSSPAPYQPPPAGSGWPDSPPGYGAPTPPPGPMQPMTPPPPGVMGPPPPAGGFAPPGAPPPSSNNATIGWIVGGIVAVLVIVAGIGAVIYFGNIGDSNDRAKNSTSTTESSQSQAPSQTPTDVVNDYYDAVRAHDVNGAYKTLCAAMQGSESQFFGSYDEETFWATVDASTYTVGAETKPSDSSAKVDVKQDIQGETYDFYAELKLESNEWKICYWSSPV